MVDFMTASERTECMSRISGRDTKPEMVVRSMTHALGFRYRLHGAALPGRPDLVFSSRRRVIFVHGCFWHRHGCPKGRSVPNTNRQFWEKKLQRNQERDAENCHLLEAQGWKVMEIWECEVPRRSCLRTRIEKFLGN